MSKPSVAIIGGGMAGLTAAWALSARGAQVHVFERETLPCTHASGKNAAIFRHAEAHENEAKMALSARVALDKLAPGWLRKTGAYYLSQDAAALLPYESALTKAGVRFEKLDKSALKKRAPEVQNVSWALFVPDDGVIDIHLVQSKLVERAKEKGAHFSFGARAELIVDNDRALGVRVDESLHEHSHTLIASGAWANESAGALSLSHTPYLRHLALLENEDPRDIDAPVLWRVDDREVYVRSEGERVLACACDESARPPDHQVIEDGILPALFEKMKHTFAPYSSARVHTVWSCLRTFAPDRRLVVGQDPRVKNLFWHTGLGGHGMTLSMASAQRLAAAMLEGKHDERLSPARLIRESETS